MDDKNLEVSVLWPPAKFHSLALKFVHSIGFRHKELIVVEVLPHLSEAHILCLHRDHAELQSITNDPLGHLFVHGREGSGSLVFLTGLPHLFVYQLHGLLARFGSSALDDLSFLNNGRP